MPEGPKQVFVERLVLLRNAAGQPTYESIERGAGADPRPREEGPAGTDAHRPLAQADPRLVQRTSCPGGLAPARTGYSVS